MIFASRKCLQYCMRSRSSIVYDYDTQKAELDLLGSLVFLPLSLLSLQLLPCLLPLNLIFPTYGNVLGLVITEEVLESLLNNPAARVVNNHHCRHCGLELVRKRHEAQLFVDLRDELGCARESNERHTDEAVVHALVLADRLTERTTLIIDGERRDLLDKLEQVDGAVEKGRLKIAFEVYIVIFPAGCQ